MFWNINSLIPSEELEQCINIFLKDLAWQLRIIGFLKKSNRGDVLHTLQCPTNSLFFTRFIEGLLKRMNKMVWSDLALDPRILHIILDNMEKN